MKQLRSIKYIARGTYILKRTEEITSSVRVFKSGSKLKFNMRVIDEAEEHLERTTHEDKMAFWKEISIFALVALLLYILNIILPLLIRVCLNFIHLFTK